MCDMAYDVLKLRSYRMLASFRIKGKSFFFCDNTYFSKSLTKLCFTRGNSYRR